MLVFQMIAEVPGEEEPENASGKPVRCGIYVAAEPAQEGADMGEANTFADRVLNAGAAEGFEDALEVGGFDATAIVLDFEQRAAAFSRPRIRMRPGAICRNI